MDALLESNVNSVTFNFQDEITNTTARILQLTEAKESLTQRQHIVEAERSRLNNEIKECRHRILTDLSSRLMEEIHRLEEFPSVPFPTPSLERSLTFPTAKELAEPVQRAKIQFHHGNKNLATERKMGRELRERERGRQEQLQIEADFALSEANLLEEFSYIRPASRFHHLKPFPKKSLKSLILMWAEKIEYASTLVLLDSKKNIAPTWKTQKHVQDIQETSKQFYLQPNIDKEQFSKHWNSMRETRNSFAQIKFDLMKEISRRQIEGYAEIQRLRKKKLELKKCISEMYAESNKIRTEISAGRKYLVKLHEKLKDRSCKYSVE